MNFGKLLLANVLGRIITGLLGIGVLAGLVLIVSLMGPDDDSTEPLSKGGVTLAPQATQSTTEPVPTASTPDENEQRVTLIGKMRSEGLFSALTDDQTWAKAQKVCQDFDAGVPHRTDWKDTDADLQEMSFEQNTVYILCPKYSTQVEQVG